MALSLRTKERLLEVWLKDGRNEKVRTSVSNKLRQVLNLDPDQVTLYYKEHQKSIKVTQITYILLRINLL
jgi:translation initiation factor 4E